LNRLSPTITKDVTRVMSRIKALYRNWAIPAAAQPYMLRGIAASGWPRFPNPEFVFGPNGSTNNWICCGPRIKPRIAISWQRASGIPL
jgi:hypothetical protein